MNHSQTSVCPSSVSRRRSNVRSHSSSTYSSPVSSSGSQGRRPLVGLGITGCNTEHEFDQMRSINVPSMPSQLVPETLAFELSLEEWASGLCYPTIYNQVPNASQDSLNLYSPTSMSASPSYNSAIEISPNQDTFPGMANLWMHTPCSAPTTPSELVCTIGDSGTGGQWDQAMFPDAPISTTMPLLPFDNLSYAETTGEEIEYSTSTRENLNAGPGGAQLQVSPSTSTEERFPNTKKRSSGSPDRVVSATGLECPLCGLKFTRRSNCKEHQKMHNPEWKVKYPCEVEECRRTFGRAADLKRHMNTVHSGIRRFCCASCDRSFSRQDSLQRHECEEGKTSQRRSTSAESALLAPKSPQRVLKRSRSIAKV